MMSLSDDQSFKPIDINSLENFDKEYPINRDKSQIDFNRFKTLFEKPEPDSESDREESDEFKLMYDAKNESEEIIFKSLIARHDRPSKKNGKTGISKDPDHDEPLQKEEEPKQTSEEKGYGAGFEKGFEQGMEQGKKQGYKEGFKKGEAEGFEKAEPLGFEQGEKLGFEKGMNQGEEKALKETRQKAVEILNSLEDSLKAADSTLELLVEKYEEKIIALIQLIAQKITTTRIEMDDEIVKAMIMEALKTLVQPEQVTLSVSMDDYEYIEMIQDEFFETIESLDHVSIKSDPSIKRGGCKVETVSASISTDPESKFEAIVEAMKKAGNLGS